MRDMKECQAEVFRRSEKRIKDRKKTEKRLLALSIPLCLVLLVSAITVLPEMFSTKDKNTAPESAMGAAGSIDGSNFTYLQAEIISAESVTQPILKSDMDEVAQLYDALQAAFARGGKENTKTESNGSSLSETREENNGYTQSGGGEKYTGYQIVFTAQNGTEVVYSLEEDRLINETTKEKVALTQEQYFDLLRLCGVAITEEAQR